jgi:transposase
MDGVVMSKKEMRIFRHAMNVIEGRLSIVEFSTIIDKSYRQAQRIIKKVKEKSILGVIHGNTGKAPVNKTCPLLMKESLDLLKEDYSDFNLLHFVETIQSKEGIEVGYSSLYRQARKKNLIKQQKRRSSKTHKSRPRLPREGMLIQFDGSEHQWFGNTTCDLIAGIDDATGKIVNAEFFIGETSLHSMTVIQGIIEEHGVPEAFYMDEASIFGKRERDWNSQIARAFESLGIKLILASSPQAKGRVERLFRTLQDRLIAELNFVQISNINDANKYLKEVFIPAFNKKFSHPPREATSCFSEQKIPNLELILCRKEKRKITPGNTFSYKGMKYLLKENRDYRFRTININTHQNMSVSYDIMGKKVSVEEIVISEDNRRKSA